MLIKETRRLALDAQAADLVHLPKQSFYLRFVSDHRQTKSVKQFRARISLAIATVLDCARRQIRRAITRSTNSVCKCLAISPNFRIGTKVARIILQTSNSRNRTSNRVDVQKSLRRSPNSDSGESANHDLGGEDDGTAGRAMEFILSLSARWAHSKGRSA